MPSKGKGKKKKKTGGSAFSTDFSAAGSFIQGDYSSLEGIQDFIDESSTIGKLNKLIDERVGKSTYKNRTLEAINKRATRIVSNKWTKAGEFVYSDGNPVKSKTIYHINYIKNSEEHYMTGFEYNEKSKLIFPLKPSVFSIYNILNEQPSLKLKPITFIPTEEDYSKGFIVRYFARKANEVMSPPFEISKNQMNTSSLYIYTTFLWIIKGGRDKVRNLNMMNIEEAKEDIPNIGKLLSPLQFYKGSKETLATEQGILNKLGIKQSQSVETVSLNVLGSEATIGQGLLDTMGGKKKVKKKNTKKKKKY